MKAITKRGPTEDRKREQMRKTLEEINNDVTLWRGMAEHQLERDRLARARAALTAWLLRIRGEVGFMLGRVNRADLKEALTFEERDTVTTILMRCDTELSQAEHLAMPREFTEVNHIPVGPGSRGTDETRG